MKTKIHIGNILTTKDSGEVLFFPDSAICEKDGKIAFIGDEAIAARKFTNSIILDHKDSFIPPGMIDLHTHLPQYEAIGLGKATLLEWLDHQIFPLEEIFEDLNYARVIAKKFLKDLIRNGTTTAIVFGPAQKAATDIAFQEAEKLGIRLFMGKTMMDIGSSKLVSSTKQNIDDTISLAEKWNGANDDLLNYIILPRYAGSCSMELMREAANISKQNGLMLQTHLSENKDELLYIKKLYPKHKTYLDIYEKAGMMGDNSQFVHCIHLSDEEVETIKSSGSSIIHCPVSNRYLQSGVMPLISYLNNGVHVGLGTDIAGGYSFSILNEAREAIESTKTYNIINIIPQATLSPVDAFKMATINAARILKISNETGSLELGKYADMIIIDAQGIINETKTGGISSLINRIIYRHQDMIIKEVYVRGKLVSKRNSFR
jgi:guanine deaminase